MENVVDKKVEKRDGQLLVEKVHLQISFKKVFHTFYMIKDINLLNLHQNDKLWIKYNND